jgi:hypothetical protein
MATWTAQDVTAEIIELVALGNKRPRTSCGGGPDGNDPRSLDTSSRQVLTP